MAPSQDGSGGAFVHPHWHPGRVRIVPREEADAAADEMRILFTHEPVMAAPMGCPHICLYTSRAPASVVEARILDHLENVEHRHMR